MALIFGSIFKKELSCPNSPFKGFLFRTLHLESSLARNHTEFVVCHNENESEWAAPLAFLPALISHACTPLTLLPPSPSPNRFIHLPHFPPL